MASTVILANKPSGEVVYINTVEVALVAVTPMGDLDFLFTSGHYQLVTNPGGETLTAYESAVGYSPTEATAVETEPVPTTPS